MFLEARYCINLCKGTAVEEEEFYFELSLLTTSHGVYIMLACKSIFDDVFFLKNKSAAFQPWPRCRRPSDGAWWWVTWRQPPSWCWWSSQTVCQPAVGCSHSFRLCSGSDLRREGSGKEGSRRWINAADKLIYCLERDVLHVASTCLLQQERAASIEKDGNEMGWLKMDELTLWRQETVLRK